RLQPLDVDLEDAVDLGAQAHLALDGAVLHDTRATDERCQAAGRLVLVDITGFHPDDVQLIDPGIGYDRPVIAAENPSLDQQRPVMVIRDHQGLREHGAVDRRRVQARSSKRFRLHAAGAGSAARPGIGPPCFPWRTATICDRIASAVSSAVWAPRSSPIGACTRPSWAGLTPAAVRRATRSRCVFLLPMAP